MKIDVFQEKIVDMLSVVLRQKQITPERASIFAKDVLDMGADFVTPEKIRDLRERFPELKEQLFILMKQVDAERSKMKTSEIKEKLQQYATENKS